MRDALQKLARNDETASATASIRKAAPGKESLTGKLKPQSGTAVQAKTVGTPASTARGVGGSADVWADAAYRGAPAPEAGGQVVQMLSEGKAAAPAAPAAPAGQDNDPFRVARGQLTFDAEGTEGGRFHTRRAHWPGGASGVTIGRGYDLGQHSKNQITRDMTSSGVSSGNAAKFAAAAGLTGTAAKNWLDANRSSLPEITPEQQEALFAIVYGALAGDVERISKSYAETMSERTGRAESDFQVNWSTVHPAIRDVLVDLRYRGDYTPTTRQRVQQPAVANDLRALYDVIRDKAYWVDQRGVPLDRFNRRVQFLESALRGGQNEPQTPGGNGQGNGGTGTPDPQKPGPRAEYVVTATSLNVRSSPSTSGKRIGGLDKNARVSGSPLGNGWVEISFNGQKAYVSAEFLAPVQQQKPKKQYTVTASSLNVRSSADSSSSENRIGSLPRGSQVTGTPLGNGWVEITFNGRKAFVSAQFLSEGGKQPGGNGPGQEGPDQGPVRLSGANWVSIANANGWVNNTAISSLDSSWGPKLQAFVQGLRASGASVSITAGLRHPKRAALMHYAWGVAGGQYTPAAANAACRQRGININWDHGSASASRAAAQALKSAFGMVHQASLTSNHVKGLAVDMSISGLPATVKFNGKSYSVQRGASGIAAARSLAPVGRELGVLWFGADDWVHWSHNGR